MKTTKLNVPVWLLIAAAVILVFAALWFAGYFDPNTPEIKKAETAKQKTEKTIDSIETATTDLIENEAEASQSSVDEADKLIQKIPTNETRAYRDTTGDYMLRHITRK